jgi:5-methylcytosine-specific restriction endonuclease McrA
MSIRNNNKSIILRNNTFERDNYTCVLCGQVGGTLNAHHIIPFSKLCIDNNIVSIDDAIKCDALWDLNNMQTLCIDCHRIVHKGDMNDY